MIRRRLSVPPERRIVRLPHVVGQARLVGVPDLRQCCIWDTFTDDDCTWLRVHRPEIGGPWTCGGSPARATLGSTQCPGVMIGDIDYMQPRIGNLAGYSAVRSGWDPDGYTWCQAQVQCAADVRVMARIALPDYVEDMLPAHVILRGTGAASDNEAVGGGYAGVGVAVLMTAGHVGVVLYDGVYSSPVQIPTAFLCLLGMATVDMPFVTLELSLRGPSLTWSATRSDTGESASGVATVGTGAGTGVGFHLVGIGWWSPGMVEFRACPL